MMNYTVGQAVQIFCEIHQYGPEGGIDQKYAWIKFGVFTIPIRNVRSRRENVYLHDINHVTMGYDTTWKGESAISAWEIASGGWRNIYVIWFMALWAMGLGVILYTGNTLRSFKKGLTMNNALTCGLTKGEMYGLPVAELRSRLSNKPRKSKNPFVWMTISFLVFVFPFILVIASIWLVAAMF